MLASRQTTQKWQMDWLPIGNGIVNENAHPGTVEHSVKSSYIPVQLLEWKGGALIWTAARKEAWK
jgi:hypothetical protein